MSEGGTAAVEMALGLLRDFYKKAVVAAVKNFWSKVSHSVTITVRLGWRILACLHKGFLVKVPEESQSHLHSCSAPLGHADSFVVACLVVCAELSGLEKLPLQVSNLTIECINFVLKSILFCCERSDHGVGNFDLGLCLITVVNCLFHALVAYGFLSCLRCSVSPQFRNEVLDQLAHFDEMVLCQVDTHSKS